MTRAEIIGSILINCFVLIVGAICSPLLKKLWARMNRPSSLTPATKGQLTKLVAETELALEHLNYLDTHPKDLFLYFIGLVLTILFLAISAAAIYVAPMYFLHPYMNVRGLAIFLILALGDLLCIAGIVESSRLSDKRIQGQRDRLQNAIDETKKKLNS